MLSCEQAISPHVSLQSCTERKEGTQQGTPAIHLRSEQNVAKVFVGDGLVVVGGGFFFVSQCEI